jgi:hypothetical protein
MGSSIFNNIQHPKKRAFLLAYGMTGLLSEATKAAGCERTIHYHWLKDPEYAEAFQLAKEMAADTHEEEATRRALGWDETRYTDDGTPYTIRKYSDTLLIVRLKALKPQEYRENQHLQVEGTITLALEDRLRQANERLVRLRNASSNVIDIQAS